MREIYSPRPTFQNSKFLKDMLNKISFILNIVEIMGFIREMLLI